MIKLNFTIRRLPNEEINNMIKCIDKILDE
jgi:hypothetical protein